MATRKVIVNGSTILDLTDRTAAADKILNGYTAYGSDGSKLTGNIPANTSSDVSIVGRDITVRAGNYASTVSKQVTLGSVGTPTATKGTVSSNSITVTPSVVTSAGYVGTETKTGTAVTVSASELVSGSETKTANGTYDVTNLASLVVNVPAGSSKNVQVVQGTTRTTSSSMTAIGAEMTVSKTGTYDVYWSAFRSNTSSQYTFATQLYVGGSAYGSESTTWSNHIQNVHLSNVSLTVNQKIRVYGRESRGSSYYMYAGTLTIVEA